MIGLLDTFANGNKTPGILLVPRMPPLPLLLCAFAFLSSAMTTRAADTKSSSNSKLESIVLGGGCFWCTEAAYKLQPGVKAVTSGYAGGKEANPTYEQVCSHVTGH